MYVWFCLHPVRAFFLFFDVVCVLFYCFFFNDTPPTEIYTYLHTLSLHDALPISHPWPGNVRQLQNALFRAAVLCEGDALTPADFPQIAAQTGPMRKDETPNAQFSDEGIGIMLYQADGNIRALADIEADVLRIAIGHYRSRLTEVERCLGIGRSP